jgi:hypothetical protein
LIKLRRVLKIRDYEIDFRLATGDRAIVGEFKMANTLGKRYLCEKCGTEVLCNKAGSGAFECCEGEMKLKEAKALPSSD